MSDKQRELALAFERAVVEGRASRVEGTPFGPAVFMDDFPSFYFGNFLLVDHLPEGAGADEVIAVLDRVQDGLGHRLAVALDEGLGRALVEGFEARGFATDRDVVLVKHRASDRAADPSIDVRQVASRELDGLRRGGWAGSGMPSATVEMLVARHHVAMPGIQVRSFAAFASDGRLVSACDLYSDGTTAQVENVETLASHQRQGFSRATCGAAIEVAEAEGHEVIYIDADEGGMPATFYGTLGFDPIATTFAFTKLPED